MATTLSRFFRGTSTIMDLTLASYPSDQPHDMCIHSQNKHHQGLCRHIMSHLKHNNSSSEAVSKAIQIMAKLCTITCQSNHSVKKESLHMIHALQTHFHQDSLSNTHNDVCIDFQNVNDFSKEINSRLPLIFPPLFNALHSTMSPKVRLATTQLCRTVLIHITHVLKGNTKAAMEHCALDSCMILTRDTDQNIIKAASDVINDYKDSMGDVLWKLYCNEIISGRILDLTVKASALAKSQRVPELRATLQLIAAYLACLGDLRRFPFGIEMLTTFRRELCGKCNITGPRCPFHHMVSSLANISKKYLTLTLTLHTYRQLSAPVKPWSEQSWFKIMITTPFIFGFDIWENQHCQLQKG
jgi:hypothetical protein